MADLKINLDNAVTETFDNDKILKLSKDSNTTAIEQDINQSIVIDDESGQLFQK